ncbi:MAG: hypothetical protein HZB51_26620 [Chloroflexi bacterium]|nr:hypothetical protein [Chloroflexota bacterium]
MPIRALLLIIVTIFVLTSCSVANTSTTTFAPTDLPPTATPSTIALTPTPTWSPQLPDWQFRWLRKIPCSAPCLEGITPGKTTASEAIEILNQNSLVRNVRREPSYGSKWESVSWDWKGSNTGGDAFYLPDNLEIIASITPHFGRDYSFRDVIQAYGEPTYIIAIADLLVSEKPIFCQQAIFVYVSNGLELRTDCHTKFELNENITFSLMRFLAPTHEGYEPIDEKVRQHRDWILPWQGFKGFDYYCRDDQNGKFCLGVRP